MTATLFFEIVWMVASLVLIAISYGISKFLKGGKLGEPTPWLMSAAIINAIIGLTSVSEGLGLLQVGEQSALLAFGNAVFTVLIAVFFWMRYSTWQKLKKGKFR